MTSAVRAAPKSGFLGSRLSCGDIHALKRCFILAIRLSLYSRAILSSPCRPAVRLVGSTLGRYQMHHAYASRSSTPRRLSEF